MTISDKMKSIQLFLSLSLILVISCNYRQTGGNYIFTEGFTQGTTYHITYESTDSIDLTYQFDSLLQVFDQSLSAWLPTSILTGINENRKDVMTDTLFRTVFREAKRVNQISNGAFDITVGPVVDAWGFGPGKQMDVDSALIDSLLQYVGMEKVELSGNKVVKLLPGVRLDVNAIAQGYAVDFLSQYLDMLGIKNYMVEVGGELRTKGLNPGGTFWKVGIDRPDFGNNIPGNQLQMIVKISGRSLATSGNYRKFFEKDGVKFHHSIDPATGYPKQDRLLSATIITVECITADAYATACMVMGLDRAKEFISGLKGVDAYFVFGDENGAYQEWYTTGLKKYLEKP